MANLALDQKRDAAATRSVSNLYYAVWRWHFYAGLLVLPFLISLSITGGLYLFKDEIDGLFHSNLKQVVAQNPSQTSKPSDIIRAATTAYPGVVLKFTDPISPTTSAEVTINTETDGKLAVFVNPYTSEVLGSLPDRGTVMWTIRYLHSLKYFGTFTRYLIEIAGGWSILLVGTGVYLWWPRKQSGGVLSVRGTPKRRVFWRDTHAVTGIFVGFFIVFLAITGMPWSGVWGGKVNEWANGNNFGYPAGVRVSVPTSDEHLNHLTQTSWSLEQAKMPLSNDPHSIAEPIGVDKAVSTFNQLGLHKGYVVNIPNTPTGVYTASVYPDDVTQQRVVHLDQYTGKTLVDMNYSDYGPLGKWLEFGINTHMGQQFGLVNQIVLAIACLAIIFLAVSAGIMWWKRKPAGALGVPPLPQDSRAFRGLFIILIIGGIIFPLVGISLIVMLLLDTAYINYARILKAKKSR